MSDLRKFNDQRAAKRPVRATRAQLQKTKATTRSKLKERDVSQVTKFDHKDGLELDVTLMDDIEPHRVKRRTADSAVVSIVSLRIAERAVLNGIRKLQNILTITASSSWL